MGEVEIKDKQVTVYSHIITYGSAADEALTEQIRDEIETAWNEPLGKAFINTQWYHVNFRVTAAVSSNITDLEIYQNIDPRNNYFRIEEFVHGNISFVDALGCNSGYFKLENLYKGSTTAAHEYGHTLGLHHPRDMDIRGKGVPGIMYPRGTLVDPQFQYDPTKPSGATGGTMHPMFRKVLQKDIDNLQFGRLRFKSTTAILGAFTNIYHFSHFDTPPNGFVLPPVRG